MGEKSFSWRHFTLKWSLKDFIYVKSMYRFYFISIWKGICVFKLKKISAFGHHKVHSFSLIPVSCFVLNREWLQHLSAIPSFVSCLSHAWNKLPWCPCSSDMHTACFCWITASVGTPHWALSSHNFPQKVPQHSMWWNCYTHPTRSCPILGATSWNQGVWANEKGSLA